MSELLLSRQGPLAHVWLASNYDKKLSRQQFLNTNLVTSSTFLSNHQIQPAHPSQSASETITLRLSGQLLLGIVRIYSRKTKYLLDDINEVLYKLKNSFKYASGATLGSGTASAVNLPPQQTTISNMSRLLLQDQVTDLDLFYQEDLNLDDAPATTDPGALFSQISSFEGDASADLDRSVEYPRSEAALEQDASLDLDFDLDMDNSIEQGRDAQVALSDAEQSVLDVNAKDLQGTADMTFDLGEPLETIDELQAPAQEAQPSAQAEPRQRRTLVGVTQEGVIRTTKRKVVVDSPEALERGLPLDVLRSMQEFQNNGRFTEEFLTVKLTQAQKLELIEELAAPVSTKRRKIWNLDDQLRQRCLELSNTEEQLQQDTTMQSMDFEDTNMDIDFDLSLSGLDTEEPPAQTVNEQEIEAAVEEDNGVENPKATTQIAGELREVFYEKPSMTFKELMNKDMENAEAVPLGAVLKTATTVKINKRREATKCFFELLVLATHDCVSLEQDVVEDGTLMGTDVVVRPRDNLVSNFV